MFTNLWKKCVQWQAARRQSAPRPRRTVLRFEVLEDRVTPTNFNTSIFNGVLTLSKTGTGNGTLTIVNSGAFGGYTVTTPVGNTINGTLTTFVNAVPVNKIVINLGSGNDSITLDGTGAGGAITLSAGLSISGTAGNKSITAKTVTLGAYSTNTKINALTMNFGRGSGTETSLFTDVNVLGRAVVTHVGTGDTSFTINTSALNPVLTNSWNSLTITNGTGSDTNIIKDTDFGGNVVIKNGYGARGNVNQYGGSQNLFSAGLNTALLSAVNITVTTTSGQSDTEVYDYNVKGTVNLTSGAGVNGQSVANFVGVENNATVVGSGVPTIGNVTITASAISSLTPGANVYLGMNLIGAQDFPLFIAGKLTITGSGRGGVRTLLNNLTVSGATAITLGSGTFNNFLTIQGDKAISSYGPITVTSSATGVNLYNVQTIQGNINVNGALTFRLANATDNINLGVSNTGFVNTTGNFAITAVNGAKTLNVINSTLGGISTNIRGNGTENFTFTNTNVVGAASIIHSRTGNTVFTITDTALNLPLFNSWNTLTITDGTGSDTNLIYDTSFAGNVTIKNGNGASGNTSQYGGSRTQFSANLNTALLTIHGNLYVSTNTGQSDTEVYDYNVHGTTTILTGRGVTNQSIGNFVGIENHQTKAGSGVPNFGGAVAVTATAVTGLAPGVTVQMGTSGVANQNYPLFLNSTLAVTANGSGSASITLNDLMVPYATTTITLVATTANDSVSIQGSAIASAYWALAINSFALGNNAYNFQDVKGTLQIYGPLTLNLGSGNDTVNLAADSGNPAGVSSAILEFFNTSYFSGGAGLNTLFFAPATLFYFYTPIRKNI